MTPGREAWKHCRCTAVLHKNDQKMGLFFFTGAFCQIVRLTALPVLFGTLGHVGKNILGALLRPLSGPGFLWALL